MFQELDDADYMSGDQTVVACGFLVVRQVSVSSSLAAPSSKANSAGGLRPAELVRPTGLQQRYLRHAMVAISSNLRRSHRGV